MNKLIVDVNSGWMYGFPKEVPERFRTTGCNRVDKHKRGKFKRWLKKQCPHEIAYLRFWTKEV